MKKYLADILTFSRIILATLLIIMAIVGVSLHVGLIVFLVGELSDALDGTLSTKYPFPKSKTPKYRKYAAKYDMFADGLLAFAMMLFFTLRVNLLAGAIISVLYVTIATVLEFVVYGKFMGHPDDCTANCLMQKNFKLAKTIIMSRRRVYLLLIVLVSFWTLYASEWTILTKIILTIIAALVVVFLWFFLSQRRHYISRDAVKIEEKLSKK